MFLSDLKFLSLVVLLCVAVQNVHSKSQCTESLKTTFIGSGAVDYQSASTKVTCSGSDGCYSASAVATENGRNIYSEGCMNKFVDQYNNYATIYGYEKSNAKELCKNGSILSYTKNLGLPAEAKITKSELVTVTVKCNAMKIFSKFNTLFVAIALFISLVTVRAF